MSIRCVNCGLTGTLCRGVTEYPIGDGTFDSNPDLVEHIPTIIDWLTAYHGEMRKPLLRDFCPELAELIELYGEPEGPPISSDDPPSPAFFTSAGEGQDETIELDPSPRGSPSLHSLFSGDEEDVSMDDVLEISADPFEMDDVSETSSELSDISALTAEAEKEGSMSDDMSDAEISAERAEEEYSVFDEGSLKSAGPSSDLKRRYTALVNKVPRL